MMLKSSFAPFLLGVVALTRASPAPTATSDDAFTTPPATTGHLGKAIGGALDSTHAHSAVATLSAEAIPGPVTIQVHNREPYAISMAYGNNAGAPSLVGSPKAAPLGGSATTTLVAPTGWAGRIIVGRTYDVDGSKIEGSNNGQPNVDVSYVDGYSLAVTCACGNGGPVITGCNKSLFGLDKCPSANLGPGPICYNPEQNVANGPASPFFEPCHGAAYTYPNDNAADSGCNSNFISCCVGSSCPANTKQPAGPITGPFR